jgi:hypothetical protein
MAGVWFEKGSISRGELEFSGSFAALRMTAKSKIRGKYKRQWLNASARQKVRQGPGCTSWKFASRLFEVAT